MDYRIVIFTPTYNRPHNLHKLFSTLMDQSDKNFIWLIVNDGSSTNYEEAIEEIKNTASFVVCYLEKENGGKHSATNYAFDNLCPTDFVVVVDDDEFLYPNAVETIREYSQKYASSNVGIINFTRNDLDGYPIANPFKNYDYIMAGEERIRRKYQSDGYIGYYMDRVGNCRFPLFEGEFFMGESVLVSFITRNSTILWAYKALGKTRYLADGLTSGGRIMRLKNPRGMALYSLLVQSTNCGILNRIKYATGYFAYLIFANIEEKPFRKKWGITPFCPFITKLLGYGLAMAWKKKYGC